MLNRQFSVNQPNQVYASDITCVWTQEGWLYLAVVIDLFSVSSEEEFLEMYAKEVIKASSNKWQEWLNSGKVFFKHLVPKLSVGIDPQSDFSLSFDMKEIKKTIANSIGFITTFLHPFQDFS